MIGSRMVWFVKKNPSLSIQYFVEFILLTFLMVYALGICFARGLDDMRCVNLVLLFNK
jgi:hypothetical protein